MMILTGVGGAALVAFPALASDRISKTRFGGVAIKGYDTTAYFEHGDARKGEPDNEVEWKGAKWRFASATEAELFAADPESYAPQFGGFCTHAMSLKQIVPGDPEVWRIRDDKLYLFAKKKGRDVFDEDPATMIAAAQAYWDTLD